MGASESKRSNVSAITPIDQSELEFDHGSFDSAMFAKQALSSWQTLAAITDAAQLGPDVTRDHVEKICDEAIRYRFASVLVQPVWVSAAVGVLAGTGLPVGVVLGFPFGASLTSTLLQEAVALIRLGARELEMVIPIGQLKSGNHHAVQHTIHAVSNVAHHRDAILRVILETSLLSVQEKLRAAEIAIQAGADFIKTSTGFSGGGATLADVALMRGVAGGRCGVCGSGNVRRLSEVKDLLEAGANRICTSAPLPILRELGVD
jgi:deoxyribose-phosphate aldolase